MFATPAYAQAAGAATSGGGSYFFFGELILLGLLFYFLMIRPQQKRAKEHQAKVEAATKGDEVTTAGGIVGKVTKVDDTHVEIEIAPGVKVRHVKSTLVGITPKGAAKPAND